MLSPSSSPSASRRPRFARRLLAAAALLGLGFVALPVRAEDAPKPAAGAAAAREFDTAEAAAKALVDAVAANDDATLEALAGGGASDVVQNGRDPQVAKDREKFTEAAKKKMTLEKKADDEFVIVIGDEEWPFPLPIVKVGQKWHFDAEEGRLEILARRIGRNELNAIKACREFVAAEAAYASKDRDGDKVREYAQKLVSTPGKQDGLWWPDAPGQDESPLSEPYSLFKDRIRDPNAAPYMGYFWRILLAQGANAPGGAHSYVVNGNLIAGFALIGVPAVYRNTGVMTLLVSHHGTVYQKDLGANSLRDAGLIETFDPDSSWAEVPAEDLSASAKD